MDVLDSTGYPVKEFKFAQRHYVCVYAEGDHEKSKYPYTISIMATVCHTKPHKVVLSRVRVRKQLIKQSNIVDAVTSDSKVHYDDIHNPSVCGIAVDTCEQEPILFRIVVTACDRHSISPVTSCRLTITATAVNEFHTASSDCRIDVVQ
jgi:hypothetical protein